MSDKEQGACTMYRPSERYCASGFFQLTGFCSGKSVGCHACGTVTRFPDCLRDEPRYHTVKAAESK